MFKGGKLPEAQTNIFKQTCLQIQSNNSDMKLDTPEIAWHGKKPILSVDFSKVGSKWRLASAGADNDVKVSKLTI